MISLYYLGLENKYPNDWKQLCNFLPQGLAIQTDNTKSWIYCNSSLCALLNVEQSSSAYDKMEKIKNKLGKNHLNTPVFNDINSKDSEFITVLLEDVGNKVFEILYRKIFWRGEKMYLYTLKDAAEKNKIEYLKVANIIKSRILKSLSHELRNPINCILNSLEYCKDKLNEDEESWTNVNIALANGNILLNKYNDILDYLKFEMGEFKLEYVHFDIRKLIDELNNLLALQISFRGLNYSCEIDDKIPKEIYSDPNRIIQVSLNLIDRKSVV